MNEAYVQKYKKGGWAKIYPQFPISLQYQYTASGFQANLPLVFQKPCFRSNSEIPIPAYFLMQIFLRTRTAFLVRGEHYISIHDTRSPHEQLGRAVISASP